MGGREGDVVVGGGFVVREDGAQGEEDVGDEEETDEVDEGGCDGYGRVKGGEAEEEVQTARISRGVGSRGVGGLTSCECGR